MEKATIFLKNVENRSVKTAENVLIIGEVFALNDFSPTSYDRYTLSVILFRHPR